MSPDPDRRDLVAEHILRVVEQVPAGRVVSYGDIAALLGLGPRQVGSVLAAWGSQVPWWRVTNAAGELPAHLTASARERWAREGTPVKRAGNGVRIAAARADLRRLADDAERARADLAPLRA